MPFQTSFTPSQVLEHLHKGFGREGSHYPPAIVSLSQFTGGDLWVESPTGTVGKNYLENQMMLKFADICRNTVIWQKHQKRRSFEQAVQPG